MMEIKNCVKCKEEINPLRIKAPTDPKTCVNCSTVGAKRGVPVMFGSKDHTWTDLVVMDENEYKAYEEREKSKSTGLDKLED